MKKENFYSLFLIFGVPICCVVSAYFFSEQIEPRLPRNPTSTLPPLQPPLETPTLISPTVEPGVPLADYFKEPPTGECYPVWDPTHTNYGEKPLGSIPTTSMDDVLNGIHSRYTIKDGPFTNNNPYRVEWVRFPNGRFGLATVGELQLNWKNIPNGTVVCDVKPPTQ